MFFSIIGDIRDSKKVLDRFEVQEKLESVLKQINEKYDSNIAAKFVITLGDEFQGFLYTSYNLFRIIYEIKYRMEPINVRFGIGYGTINTRVIPERALGMDGPSWYVAREAIEEMKERNKKQKLHKYGNIRIEMNDINGDLVNLINSTLSIVEVIEKDWTTREKDVAKHIIIKYGFKQKFKQNDVANFMNVSAPAINRLIKKSNLLYFLEVYSSLEKILMNGGKING